MCGIVGALMKGTREQSVEIVARGVSALAHRGPDDKDIVEVDSSHDNVKVVFGHRRLSIIDLSEGGHQPMRDRETGNWITYNGEVYSYLSLRKELEDERRRWVSHSDTEVVLRAFAKWGVDCFEKLRGMYALAVWDVRKQELVLARDPFGIKPLYYYRTENLFLFASEIRALLASGLVPRRLSPEGLASFLDFGSVEAPATILEGVRSLLPGHSMTVRFSGNSFQTEEKFFAEKLWATDERVAVKNRDEAVVQLREILEESVRLHLVSDVPLGLFLSGGMDSSALVALMSRVSTERPKTFSVVFAEGKFTEAAHARYVAEKFETDHQEIPLSEDDLLGLLPSALSAIDQPTIDGINTYVVSKAVKESGATVALSGLGGDELFAGYSTFRRALRMKRLERFPPRLRRTALALGKPFANGSVQKKKLWQLLTSEGSARDVYKISRQLFAPDERLALLVEDADEVERENSNGLHDIVNAVSLYELRGYMANTLLRDTDAMSMAHSLEVRVPFVDAEVVRFMLGLPGAWKMRGDGPKPLLQDVIKDLLPTEFMRRPKMGFTLPFESWMQSRLRDQINQKFADEGGFIKLGIRPEAAQKVWARFLLNPRSVGWSRPWSLFVLANWCELHQIEL
ncbi:MAG: asparagine synthase (glutamine-hydrolyzing) [Acidobacteria bacterium 13_1_20CM_3_53_8]|nr:MAG: asparagine synthase (glutamine-hydrolyzing) [Acidobacteria bacterium 13_1_20CM_3_53_8]